MTFAQPPKHQPKVKNDKDRLTRCLQIRRSTIELAACLIDNETIPEKADHLGFVTLSDQEREKPPSCVISSDRNRRTPRAGNVRVTAGRLRVP
jgi:hypothetical protein